MQLLNRIFEREGLYTRLFMVASFVAAVVFALFTFFDESSLVEKSILGLLGFIAFSLIFERLDTSYITQRNIKEIKGELTKLSGSDSPYVISNGDRFLTEIVNRHHLSPHQLEDFFFYSIYPTDDLISFIRASGQTLQQRPDLEYRFLFPNTAVLKKRFNTRRGFEGEAYKELIRTVIRKFEALQDVINLYELEENKHIKIRYYTSSPVANVVVFNGLRKNPTSINGYIFYIPFMYGDYNFPKIPKENPTNRPTIEIYACAHPDWFENLQTRFVYHMWEEAGKEENQKANPKMLRQIIEDLRSVLNED